MRSGECRFIVLIMGTGILLTVRLPGSPVQKAGKSPAKYMVKNEDDGIGEVSSFRRFVHRLAATIGTGNIVGVATAVMAGALARYSGWYWLPVWEWLQNTQRGFLPSSSGKTEAEADSGRPFYYIEKVWQKMELAGQRSSPLSDWEPAFWA